MGVDMVRRIPVFLSMRIVACPVAALVPPAGATGGIGGHDAEPEFTSSDGVRRHDLEARPRAATRSSLFQAGPCPPAPGAEIQASGQRYHVAAFDPCGQGDLDAPSSGDDRLGAVRTSPS